MHARRRNASEEADFALFQHLLQVLDAVSDLANARTGQQRAAAERWLERAVPLLAESLADTTGEPETGTAGTANGSVSRALPLGNAARNGHGWKTSGHDGRRGSFHEDN